jgi:hypothetical protein
MILSAGIPNAFSAAFVGATPGFVAMSVWDISTSSPSLVQNPTLMTALSTDIYSALFTPSNSHNYVAVMAVYTDGTFATINSSFVPVVCAFTAQFTIPAVQSVIGVVNCQEGT